VIAKLEESRTKFAASQMGSFCNDCSPPLYSATALPLKAETFRPLADMADVFFVQCVGYGAFRGGGSRYHHRGCRWLYKGWAKATSPREKNREQDRETNREQDREKTEQDRGKNRARQREETQQNRERKYTEKQRKRKQRNPEKTNLTSLSPQFPQQIRERKNPSSKPWPSSSPEKRKTEGAGVHRRERNRRPTSFLATSRSR
jgi:hypothetical protein